MGYGGASEGRGGDDLEGVLGWLILGLKIDAAILYNIELFCGQMQPISRPSPPIEYLIKEA